MEIVLQILILAASLIGAIYLLIIYFRSVFRHAYALKNIHLRILIPRKDSDQDERKETAKDFKESIAVMEQLLVSMSSLYSGKIKKKLLGQDTFSFEYISHKNETFFHVVIPHNYQSLIEKQITSYYTDATIEVVDEIDIFTNATCIANTSIYLKKDFVYPIKTYQKLESDPINNITNALSKLSENESCVFQVVLQPVASGWQNKASKQAKTLQGGKSFSLNPFVLIGQLFSTLISGTKEEKANEKDSSALESEIINLIDEKGKKVGFETTIRIITTGTDQHVCDMQLKNVISSLEQFGSPDTNRFSPTNYHNTHLLTRSYIYRYFGQIRWKKKKILLNTEEIASIFHFPHSKFNQTPEIKWQNFKIAKAPKDTPNSGLLLGHNVYRNTKIPVYMKNEDRMRHFYVVGQTGTGKSTMLTQMAKQDVREGRGICVMDPHGDLAADVIRFIPKSRADDVIYFNPGDITRPMGINLLEADMPEEKESVAQEATKMMIKLYGNEVFGPRIQDYFTNIALTLMDSPMGGTLCDVMPMASNKAFQDERRRTLKNTVVKSWWDNTYDGQADREKKEIIPYFQAKFSPFSTNEMMRNIVGQTKSSFKVHEVMDQKKILLLNLSKGLLGDLNSTLIGMMFVSKIQTAAMQRQKTAKEDRVDFFFYIDEFQNFVTDSIEGILSEARKYRLSLNLAHQYIGQLEKSDALTKSSVNLKDAVFGNVGTKMSYKVGAVDAEYLQKEFGPTFSDHDLVNMDKFKGVIKLAIDNQPSVPFSLIPINPFDGETPNENLMKGMIELSRLKYGREKEFVSKEILFRIGAGNK